PSQSQHVPPDDLTKSSSKSSVKSSKEGALARTRASLEKGKTREPSRKPQPFHKTQPTQESLRGRAIKDASRKPSDGWVLSDQELGERVEKLWHAGVEPELIVATLAKYATHERIRRVLSHRYNVPWVSI